MSFAQDLLKNPQAKIGVTPSRPATVVRPVTPPATESIGKQVKKRLNESAGAGKSVVLSAQEAIALSQLITEMEFDPFKDEKSVLDTRDLEKLGLEVDKDPAPSENDEEEDPTDPFDDGKSSSEGPKNDAPQVGADRINISTAIVAPDATPGHDEPIPQSVLQSLSVLNGRGNETPVHPAAPAPTHGTPVPPAPASAPAPAASTESTKRNAVPLNEVMSRFRRAYQREAGFAPVKPGVDTTIHESYADVAADPTAGPKGVANFMAKFRKAAKNSA